MNILITGGAGFIGSHTCVELLAAGYEVAILDNLCNSRRSVVDRIEKISGRKVEFFEGDVRDRPFLARVFTARAFSAVIHFAGLKAAGESVLEPLPYYDNNVTGSNCVIEAMERAGVRSMIFSSSASVYGEAARSPLREDAALGPTNPYGRTKLMIEWMLTDFAHSRSNWRAVLLRYFNPIGAHESGLIGEDPKGIPNNLMPYVTQVAVGRLQQLTIFGNDYPTRDGTGVRDYIHVVDLALGHLAALRAIERLDPVSLFNLGTGHGSSVLEIVSAFERASGRNVPYRIAPRRPGDVAASFSDPGRAANVLGWRTERDLEAMCRDSWRWQEWQAAHDAEL